MDTDTKIPLMSQIKKNKKHATIRCRVAPCVKYFAANTLFFTTVYIGAYIYFSMGAFGQLVSLLSIIQYIFELYILHTGESTDKLVQSLRLHHYIGIGIFLVAFQFFNWDSTTCLVVTVWRCGGDIPQALNWLLPEQFWNIKNILRDVKQELRFIAFMIYIVKFPESTRETCVAVVLQALLMWRLDTDWCRAIKTARVWIFMLFTVTMYIICQSSRIGSLS